jgi:hypothetical protein
MNTMLCYTKEKPMKEYPSNNAVVRNEGK